jgi:large conductance mechanosensitive channel
MSKKEPVKSTVKQAGHLAKDSGKLVLAKSIRGAKKLDLALKGFKDFVAHGSSFELAVGVVIGGAVSALVNAIVQGVINPLIALLVNVKDFSEVWLVHVGTVTFSFGIVLSAMLNLVLISAVIYFGFILPLNKLHKYVADEKTPDYPQETVELLRDIKAELQKTPKK